MARPKKKVKTPEESIQESISNIVIDSEYRNAATMQSAEMQDFESLVDIVEGRRNEKDYEWMSDYHIPEFNSILHAEAADWAGEMFSTRDFCEVKLDGDKPDDQRRANAAKKIINKTLNDRDIFYYPKYIRLRTINSLIGKCYVVCWWDQEIVKDSIKQRRPKPMPEIGYDEIDVEFERAIVDRFNFDVVDPRNVFTDNSYCYSIQQKPWVIIRSEVSFSDLMAKKDTNNYFNLDKVREAIKETNKQKSDTAKDTYAKDANGEIDKTPVRLFDILDRYGKFWAVVQERDKWGNPTKATPGIDEDGLPLDNAELVEMVMTFVLIGNTKIQIRFDPTDKISAEGKPYKPIVRGICYIHPTKDEGLSDGKNARELQIAIDDTFNMTFDATKLEVMPTFLGNKANQDDLDFYFEPEHINWVNDVERDIKQLQVRANVDGSMKQQAMLTGKMQQVTARFPTTMGALPDAASTTATAVAGADQRTNSRHHYKSLTFEYAFLQEFYWIILQMYYRFAKDETLVKLLGDDVGFFDANADYTYTPVTQAIETEQNKNKKIQLYDQSIGRLSGLAKVTPAVIPIIARMVGRQMELYGDEYAQYGHLITNLSKAKPQEESATPNQVKDMSETPVSNQNGMEMSTMEQGARSDMMTGGGMIK